MATETAKKRLTISVDPELHKQLKIMAAEQDTTVAKIVSDAIKKQLDMMKK